MEYVYAVQNEEELVRYRQFAARIAPRLSRYLDFLRGEYCVQELPKAIVWTSRETATQLISAIPVPAYTNDYRVVFTPDLAAWRDIYLHQLDSLEGDCEALREYYQKKLTENHLLQILGHEFVHHSEFFPDDEERESGIWFEEGMAEYISRRYFLSSQEYDDLLRCNRNLVRLLSPVYDTGTLESFGAATYREDYAGIFFAYWRSFLAVHDLVQAQNGDVQEVFAAYRRWLEAGEKVTLARWFGLEKK